MPPDTVLFAFLPPLLASAASAGVAAVVVHWFVGGVRADYDHCASRYCRGQGRGGQDRIVESLGGNPRRGRRVNDALAIVLYGIAVTARVSRHFAWSEAFWSLLR